MFGKGLLKGLFVTGKEAVSPRLTEKYPEERPNLPKCFRGNSFHLDKETCIKCGLCKMACPNQAISMTIAKDEEGQKYFEEFTMDRQYCLFCGLCVEACPKNCLSFTKEFESAVYQRQNVPQNLLKEDAGEVELSTFGHPVKKAVPKPAPKPAETTTEKPAETKTEITENKAVEKKEGEA